MKDLTYDELNNIEGGVAPPFWVGVAVGWVVGEIVQGIYQADKRGCL
jgi:lactobin A/cerein 7B family class IIb bacteriocin